MVSYGQCWQRPGTVIRRVMTSEANSTHNGSEEIKFGSLDGREDGEHNGLGFVEVS